MTNTAATAKPRRTPQGTYQLDTPAGTVTFAKVNANGQGPSWGHTAPGGHLVTSHGFGTLTEACQHAAAAHLA